MKKGQKHKVKNMKILIGLEDKKQRDEIVSVLSRTFTVVTAFDSEEAYERIHHIDPDLAILDYTLSKINPINLYDGIAFIHSNVHMVICVTSENLEVARRVWSRRAIDFILKPIQTDRFVHDVLKITRYLVDKAELEAVREQVETLQQEIDSLKQKLKKTKS